MMSKEEKFKFDIANLQKDLAIEDMAVNQEDIDLLKRYSNNEITMSEMIQEIKDAIIQGV